MADKRYYYHYYVIDAKDEKVLDEGNVFGFGRDDVLAQLGIRDLATKHETKPKNISTIIIELGEVRESSKYDKVIVVEDV